MYFPKVGVGITSFDVRDGSAHDTPLAPAHYDLVHADPTRRYLAAVSDDGDTVSFVERTAPGTLVPLATIDMPSAVPDWAWSRAVDIDDEGAMILVRTQAGGLAVYATDMRGGALELLTHVDVDYLFESWHGLVVRGERIVYTTLLGQVFVFDWTGERIGLTHMAPLVRQVLYDAERELAYAVDDFGFVMIVDVRTGALVRRWFGGFKTKNLHLERDALYFGSSAGLFRIDLERALAGGGRSPS